MSKPCTTRGSRCETLLGGGNRAPAAAAITGFHASSCAQASSAKSGGEKDARLQYLSWRIWHMRRRHAGVKHARRSGDEEASLADEATTGYSTEEEEEAFRDVKSPQRGKAREAAPLAAEARGAAEVTDVAPPSAPSTASEGAPKAKLQVKLGGQEVAPQLETGALGALGAVLCSDLRATGPDGRCGCWWQRARALPAPTLPQCLRIW